VAALDAIVAYCQDRLGLPDFPDFPGALNGLQVANDGRVTRIGAAVDASIGALRQAAEKGADFVVVHHGLFWETPRPWTGRLREKLGLLVEKNIAVYSAHLPLDAHTDLGNNALLARKLGLDPLMTFHEFEGRDVGLVSSFNGSRPVLARKLESLFPRVTRIEFGREQIRSVAIVTGGGGSSIDALPAGVDTLVTGELREHHYVVAEERGLNLYACGHYATEVFGVCALAEDVGRRFDLPWEFLATENPL
jgi:dinuclear metal center YbgI/SA1388 family protein